MEVSGVTELDGKKCAQLINLLKAGKWELSGPDIVAHTETVRWVSELATKMAAQLRSGAQAPAAGGFRVKSAGPLPGAPAMKQAVSAAPKASKPKSKKSKK